MLGFNLKNVRLALNLGAHQSRVTAIHNRMQAKIADRSVQDMLGWLELPNLPQTKINQYVVFGRDFRRDIEVLVVIGIGGSFLGAKACLDWWAGTYGALAKVQTIFIGNSLGGRELTETVQFLADKKYGICVISKSGTTIEPLTALNVLTRQLQTRHGRDFYQQHVVVITTSHQGKLFALAQQEQWRVFAIDPDVGGRFSFLSPVGLIPLAINGLDLKLLLGGAAQASLDTSNPDLKFNTAYQYAVARFLMQTQHHYQVEVLASFDRTLASFGMWWQQLYAETEGKNDQGLLPLCCTFTRDLHSLEQFFKGGPRNLMFHTVFEPFFDNATPKLQQHQSAVAAIYQLPLVAVDRMNRYVFEAIIEANQLARIPTFVFNFNFKHRHLAYVFGYLVFWFMRSCAVSAQLLGVKPFDQPGVESYKRILRTKMTGNDL